ncbi:MAG: BamA/TamA family outer membrane protein, partial [Candidatus Eisenbacteria bacterium]|nr:BamA/TamA family outer membrane protein [Candidatus Eisenbacteria bacterium]
HRSLRTRDVLGILAVSEGSVFDHASIDAGVDSLIALLGGLGRPFAHVAVSWDSTEAGVAVAISIDEGPEVVLDDLTFRGIDRPVPDGFARRLKLGSGSHLTRRSLLGDIEALLTAYADEGRPFAQVALPAAVWLADDGGLTGRVEVTEGVETWFGDVVVAGNDATREHVIVRETGLDRGQSFSLSRLSEVRPRLEKLTFLDAVEEPVVAVDPVSGEATVGIAVTEGPSSRISGVLGVSGGPDGSDDLTGLVDIELGNIAGTGRLASASWERIRKNQTEISFSYTEPWVLGAPVDVSVAGSQSVRDTFYTTTEGDLLFTARLGDRTRLTWSLGAERYVPGAALESTSRSVKTAFAASYDGTDAPWNPTAGTRLAASIEYADKEISAEGRDESSGTFTAEVQGFLRVVRRQVLALRARVEALASTEEDVPFHELLVLGGARSLRGYREEQFRGTRTALGSIEYRFLLGRRARAIVFVDGGYWYREGPNFAKDTKLGYGIGLRGDTRLGTISIDYGLGEGDDLLDGKLHAGLIREF